MQAALKITCSRCSDSREWRKIKREGCSFVFVLPAPSEHVKSKINQSFRNLVHLVHFDNCLQDCIKAWSSGKEKEIRCLEHVSTFSTKHEIRQFHVLRAVTAKKSTKSVMHVQIFCFAKLTPLFFCRSRRCRWCCWLSSILFQLNRHVTRFCRQTQNLGTGHNARAFSIHVHKSFRFITSLVYP